jgi:predicted nucleic acid-binding protein
MKALVLDGSIALGFILKDERSPGALKVLERLEDGLPAFVPAHWHLEVANGLIMAERRRRATQADITEALQLVQALPVATDPETSQRATSDTAALARQYHLTIYDAAYLELALRRHAALSTTDHDLAKAAKAAGVEIFAG